LIITIREPKPSHKAYKNLIKECDKWLQMAQKELLEDDITNTSSIIINRNITTIDKIIRKLKKTLKSFEVVDIVKNWMDDNIESNNKRFDKEFAQVKNLTIHRHIDFDMVTKKDVLNETVYTTKRIKSVPRRLVENLEKALIRNVLDGSPIPIRDIIEKEIGKSAKNFDLIARNETLQINRALTHAKTMALDAEEWIYKTAGDERVRTTHKEANGKHYEMSGDTHGDKLMREINCRCYRKYIFDI